MDSPKISSFSMKSIRRPDTTKDANVPNVNPKKSTMRSSLYLESSSLSIPSTWTLSLTLYPIDFTSSRSITFARSSVIKSERLVVTAGSYWKNDDKYAYRSSIVKRLTSFDKEYWSDPCKLDPNRTLSSEHCHRHRRSARNLFFSMKSYDSATKCHDSTEIFDLSSTHMKRRSSNRDVVSIDRFPR